MVVSHQKGDHLLPPQRDHKLFWACLRVPGVSQLHSVLLHFSFNTTAGRAPEGCLMATCPCPPWGSRCCAQGLVSYYPHSCPYATFLVPGCCWVGLWGSTGPRLQLCRALGPLLLYRQPLPQVSMRTHLLETGACRPQRPYLLQICPARLGQKSAEPPCMSGEGPHHLLLGPSSISNLVEKPNQP